MSAFDWSSAPGVWPSLGPDIAKALRDIATMPIERPMTQDEFNECVERVWDALPEDALAAMAVLAAVCCEVVSGVEERRPGTAMGWMAMLQSTLDDEGVET